MADSIQLRTKSDLKAVFRQHNIWARKELGQNFLIDHNLLNFLCESGEVGPEDLVLDVGAGTGLLTRRLARSAWLVWGVEYDRRLFDFCMAFTSGLPNVQLFNKDVLKNKYQLDPELENGLQQKLAEKEGARFKVVSNLPYSISTLLIPILLEGPLEAERMVLTVQKEVGDRLVAGPGTKDYGSLSVVVQSQAEVKVLKILPNSVFWPRPKVDSAIVLIRPSRTRSEKVADRDLFIRVTRGLFAARRKKAINSLKQDRHLQVPQERIAAAFDETGMDLEQRGEAFSVDQIIEVSNALAAQEVPAPNGTR